MPRASSSPVPLYLQIADSLRDQIVRGVWRQGEIIPTLEQIADEFNVARVTARQAVQLLMSEGALTPQRGKGTFVSATAPTLKPVQVVTTLAALADMYHATTQQLLTVEENRRRPPIAPADGVLAEHYVHMKRVHASDGLRYCVISLYLEDRIFSMAPDRFREELAIPTIVELSPGSVAKARQTLTIGGADAETARLLRVPADSPVARVQRVFNDSENVVIYYADVVYRGDAVRVEMDLGSLPVKN